MARHSSCLILILQAHRKWLRFVWSDHVFQFMALPFRPFSLPVGHPHGGARIRRFTARAGHPVTKFSGRLGDSDELRCCVLPADTADAYPGFHARLHFEPEPVVPPAFTEFSLPGHGVRRGRLERSSCRTTDRQVPSGLAVVSSRPFTARALASLLSMMGSISRALNWCQWRQLGQLWHFCPSQSTSLLPPSSPGQSVMAVPRGSPLCLYSQQRKSL